MMCRVRIEVGEEATTEESNVAETKAPAGSDDREKILELIADIGSGSESMMANYQEGQVHGTSGSPDILMLYFLFSPGFGWTRHLIK